MDSASETPVESLSMISSDSLVPETELLASEGGLLLSSVLPRETSLLVVKGETSDVASVSNSSAPKSSSPDPSNSISSFLVPATGVTP